MKVVVNIQMLRFIAALMVVMFHAAPMFFRMGGDESGNIFSFIRLFGFSGVDIFFVISGYVMWITTREYSTPMSAARFVYSRYTRVYFGYWPYFLILLLIVYLTVPEKMSRANLMGSLLLTEPRSGKQLLPVAWTLTYELYFYTCFSLLLLFTRKIRVKMLAFLFLAVIAVQAGAILSGDVYNVMTWANASMVPKFFMSSYCLEFIAGCFVGVYFDNRRLTLIWIPIVLIPLTLYFAILYQAGLPGGSISVGYFVPQRVLFFGPIAIMLVVLCVELNYRGAIFPKKISLLFGGSSYSLYLAHTVIYLIFNQLGGYVFVRDIDREYLPMFAVGLLILTSVLYSIFHYVHVEKRLTVYALKGRKIFFGK